MKDVSILLKDLFELNSSNIEFKINKSAGKWNKQTCIEYLTSIDRNHIPFKKGNIKPFQEIDFLYSIVSKAVRYYDDKQIPPHGTRRPYHGDKLKVKKILKGLLQ